jgi:hypothetical protein
MRINVRWTETDGGSVGSGEIPEAGSVDVLGVHASQAGPGAAVVWARGWTGCEIPADGQEVWLPEPEAWVTVTR